MNTMTIIGIILTLFLTLPLLLFALLMILFQSEMLRKECSQREPSKDEWRAGL